MTLRIVLETKSNIVYFIGYVYINQYDSSTAAVSCISTDDLDLKVWDWAGGLISEQFAYK